MVMRSVGLAMLVALAGCSAPFDFGAQSPQSPQAGGGARELVPSPYQTPQTAKERFAQAVVANGCVFSQGNTDTIMTQAVVSREDLARVMTELRAEGRGEIVGGGFRIIDGACA